MRIICTLLLAVLVGTSHGAIEDLPLIPEPELVDVIDVPFYGGREYIYEHPTTLEFDSPGYQDRRYNFRLSMPPNYDPAKTYKVLVWLHGAGMGYDQIPVVPQFGALLGTFEPEECIVIMPQDEDETVWLGYSDALPDGAPRDGVVRFYTQRRLLATLRWCIERSNIGGSPLNVDLNAIFVSGVSMGGGGALHNGWTNQDLFAGVFGVVPPAGNLGELSGLGNRIVSRKMGDLDDDVPVEGTSLTAWEYIDIAQLVRWRPELRNQYFWLHWSRDDTIVPWTMVARPAAETGLNLFDFMERYKLGVYASWDEGGHLYPGQADPILQAHWWDEGWSPITDDVTYLRRNLSFPAFTEFSEDSDPGTGSGTVGEVNIPRDNRLDGDTYGTINRWLRWRSATIIDTPTAYGIELKVLDGPGRDAYTGSSRPVVNVTPRRLQRFKPQPGTRVAWRTETGQSGVATVSEFGGFTCRGIELDTDWMRLTVTPLPPIRRVFAAGYLDAGAGRPTALYAITDDAPGAVALYAGGQAVSVPGVRDLSTAVEFPLSGLGALPPNRYLLELRTGQGGLAGDTWPYLNVGE